MLDERAAEVQARSNPSNAGTEHLAEIEIRVDRAQHARYLFVRFPAGIGRRCRDAIAVEADRHRATGRDDRPQLIEQLAHLAFDEARLLFEALATPSPAPQAPNRPMPLRVESGAGGLPIRSRSLMALI
jgi:hypothetical protein